MLVAPQDIRGDAQRSDVLQKKAPVRGLTGERLRVTTPIANSWGALENYLSSPLPRAAIAPERRLKLYRQG